RSAEYVIVEKDRVEQAIAHIENQRDAIASDRCGDHNVDVIVEIGGSDVLHSAVNRCENLIVCRGDGGRYVSAGSVVDCRVQSIVGESKRMSCLIWNRNFIQSMLNLE